MSEQGHDGWHSYSTPPAPAPEAPPEWALRAAEAAYYAKPGMPYEVATAARAIAEVYAASEEARKVERLETALREMQAAPCMGELLGEDCGWCPKCRASAVLASPLVEETR